MVAADDNRRGDVAARHEVVEECTGLVALASSAWTGHSGAAEGALGLAQRGLDVVHLGAASLWLGALLVFLASLKGPPDRPRLVERLSAFARTGTLVVRELEPPSPVGQALVVDLRNLGAERERAASYALGAALAVLAAGGELVLCTAEPGGPVTGRVRAPVDAGRRLARAVEGQPGVPPGGWPVVEIGA